MALIEIEAMVEAVGGSGRLLGLDVGTKTIGLAVCDAGWRFSTPSHTLKRTKLKSDLEVLSGFVAEQEIVGLIVGLPLNMDGSSGPRAQTSRAYGRNLAERLERPVSMWDERLSTVAAERAMLEADLSRKKRAKRIDAVAAAHILQGAIDRMSAIVADRGQAPPGAV